MRFADRIPYVLKLSERKGTHKKGYNPRRDNRPGSLFGARDYVKASECILVWILMSNLLLLPNWSLQGKDGAAPLGVSLEPMEGIQEANRNPDTGVNVPLSTLSVSQSVSSHGSVTYPAAVSGIASVGTYGSYGSSAKAEYDTGGGLWDAFPTYGPTSSPRNRFQFCILTAEYGVTATGTKFNDYLRAIRSQNRVPFYRLYWGHTYNDLTGTETKLRAMMTGVDTSLIGGVIFDDDTRWTDSGVASFLNALYDWFKATYPGVAVYQIWAPSENEGPADGKPGFQASWKADGWVWYSYWANYARTKAFIQSCKTAQPGKPIIMIVDFSAQWTGGYDPYNYTFGTDPSDHGGQVQVAREEGCSVCLFSSSATDNKYGWYTSDPVTKERYAKGEALIDEVIP